MDQEAKIREFNENMKKKVKELEDAGAECSSSSRELAEMVASLQENIRNEQEFAKVIASEARVASAWKEANNEPPILNYTKDEREKFLGELKEDSDRLRGVLQQHYSTLMECTAKHRELLAEIDAEHEEYMASMKADLDRADADLEMYQKEKNSTIRELGELCSVLDKAATAQEQQELVWQEHFEHVSSENPVLRELLQSFKNVVVAVDDPSASASPPSEATSNSEEKGNV